MLGLYYNLRFIRLGFPFCTLLATHNLGLAKEKKNTEKEVSVVSPSIQSSTSAADNGHTFTQAKIQNELEIENALNRARLEKQLSTIISQIERLRLLKEHKRLTRTIKDENTRQAHDHAMLLLNMEREKLSIELELAQVKSLKQMAQYDAQLTELDKKIQLEKGKAQLLQETTHRVQAEIEALQAKKARDNHIEKKPIYLKDPLIKKTNTLVLSDRCIKLNGDITPWKANYIADQIQYFNNKNSAYPIFLIIGDSPGGSLNAGCHLLQAIEHSKAPVYVVVKVSVASMAALITTLATKSYVYPNAKILHHQPMFFVNYSTTLNLRATKEEYAKLNEIWKRLGGRVAKKMGISLKEFDKKIYEKSIYGNWEEYGDNAKKLKWVDHVISGIQHSAISSLPDAADYTFEKFIKEHYGFDAAQEQSAEARHYHALAPHDFNYSYKPQEKTQMMANK